MPSARKESLRFVIPLLVVFCALLGVLMISPGRILSIIVCLMATLLGILLLFILYFFRDPERIVPTDEKIIVSAADGLVVDIVEMDEPDFQLGRMKRIAVFLSVFDVHVNRAPVAGRVIKKIYKAGEFLDVRHPESSMRNEYLAWLMETPRGPVAVRQIAGLVARRIVDWSQRRRLRGAGVPLWHDPLRVTYGGVSSLDCTVLVKPGDRVAGASTPIALWPK